MFTSFSYEAVGVAGAVVYILAYACLQAGFLRGTGYAYPAINFLAATLVLISLMDAFNLSSAIIQVTWIAISIYGIVRQFLISQMARLNDEERAMIGTKFPGMTNQDARKFLDLGEWKEFDAGAEITKEGEAFGRLAWVSDGRLKVYTAEQEIGTILPGTFLGEFTVFNDSPATATVRTVEPSRLFQIEAESLKKLCDNNSHIASLIQLSLGADARLKIQAANRLLGKFAIENGSPLTVRTE